MLNNIITAKDCVLGIDTSNYKTSVAVIDINGNVLSDHRQLLSVKQGERGLRQSDAVFSHINNLPVVAERRANRGGNKVANATPAIVFNGNHDSFLVAE